MLIGRGCSGKSGSRPASGVAERPGLEMSHWKQVSNRTQGLPLGRSNLDAQGAHLNTSQTAELPQQGGEFSCLRVNGCVGGH